MTEITWCKLFHDFADDAKFLRVADMTGATVELVQACFARALCRASSNPDRGSTKNIDQAEFAWWFKKPVELIRSIFDCFEQVSRMIADDRLANWAKRQGAAAEKLAQGAMAAISAGAQRMRRYRQRKAADGRQGQFEFAQAAPAAAAGSVTSRVTRPVTAAAETETDCSASKRDAESREVPTAEVLRIHDFQKPRRRRSELAPNWQPDNDDRDFAAARGHDPARIEHQAELFRAHYRAKGAVHVDWHECWKAWVLRAGDFAPSPSGGRFRENRGGRGSIVAAARAVLARSAAAAAQGSYADI